MEIARTAGMSACCLMLLVAQSPRASAESWCEAPADPALAALKLADVRDDWFKVYAVVPGVFAITEPRQYEAVSSFLIVRELNPTSIPVYGAGALPPAARRP